MDVAVPEAGDNRLAGAIDHARIRGNLNLIGAANGGDDAHRRHNDRIGNRRRFGRGVERAAFQHQRLSLRRGT